MRRPILLRLRPIAVERVWGGRRLASALGRRLPAGMRVGESWEVSDIEGQASVIADGPSAGRTLRDVIGEPFPLLVKWIDAREDLSVQVHPDDRLARKLERQPRGKTEAWVVVEADPGARLVLGFRAGVRRPNIREACRNGTIVSLLRRVKVRRGDVVFSPAGTVHSIGGGLLLLEVQQSSDTTYRLYDWGRVGLDGLPRELHLEKGTRALRLSPRRAGIVGRIPGNPTKRLKHLLTSRAFVLDAARVDGTLEAASCGTSEVWAALEGEGEVWVDGVGAERGSPKPGPIARGDCIVVLPGRGRVGFRSSAGLTLLRARPGRAARRSGSARAG